MSEAVVANTALVVRMMVLGGIFLILPRITRKGLLFGVYIGEEAAGGAPARELRSRWYRNTLVLIVCALVLGLGISAAGWPLTGNFTGTGFILLAATVLYIRTHFAAKKIAPPSASAQGRTAVAALDNAMPRGTTLAWTALAITVLAGIGTVTYAAVSYPALPDQVPTHFGLSGDPDAWSSKSISSVMIPSLMNLVLSPFIALFALLTSRAKQSLRGGTGGRSAEAQAAFRAAIANFLSGTALFTCALMTVLSVNAIRVGLGQTGSLGPWVFLPIVAMLVFMTVGLIRIMVKYGQGGSRMESGSPEAPLTNGIADDANWVWGVFYINREDPSFMVEKRFGLGYTLNFGNRRAVWLMAVFLILIFGLTAWAIIGAAG